MDETLANFFRDQFKELKNEIKMLVTRAEHDALADRIKSLELKEQARSIIEAQQKGAETVKSNFIDRAIDAAWKIAPYAIAFLFGGAVHHWFF